MNGMSTHPKADLLWTRLMHRYRRGDITPSERVSIVQLGNNIGLHQEQSRQIARTWESNGLVELNRSTANYVRLTETGREKLDEMD